MLLIVLQKEQTRDMKKKKKTLNQVILALVHMRLSGLWKQ